MFRHITGFRAFLFVLALAADWSAAVRSAAAEDKIAPAATVLVIETAKDSKWIRTETEFVAVFPLPLPSIAEVLRDYAAYPRYVPHLVRTDVLPGGEHEARIGQHYDIALFNCHFRTDYDLNIDSDDSGYPSRWEQTWELAATDGSIGESKGSWILEDIGTDEAPATRVIHRNRGLVRKSFPLQVAIMRAAAERELGGSIAAVGDEAMNRRNGRLAQGR